MTHHSYDARCDAKRRIALVGNDVATEAADIALMGTSLDATLYSFRLGIKR